MAKRTQVVGAMARLVDKAVKYELGIGEENFSYRGEKTLYKVMQNALEELDIKDDDPEIHQAKLEAGDLKEHYNDLLNKVKTDFATAIDARGKGKG